MLDLHFELHYITIINWYVILIINHSILLPGPSFNQVDLAYLNEQFQIKIMLHFKCI